MPLPFSSSPAQARQIRQQFASSEDYLSYELGKAVKELPPFYTRLLAGSISLMLFGAIAWAHVSQVDEVAIAPGELVPSAQVRPVRSLSSGNISDIRVKEGDRVKPGDILIERDTTLSKAEIERLENSARLIQEDLARLEAERTGNITTGVGLQDQLLAARLQEFDTRRAAAIAEANRQNAIVSEARVRYSGLQDNLVNARRTVESAQQREAGLRTLASPEIGAVPRIDYLEAQDRLTQAQDQVGSLERDIAAQAQTIQQAEQAYQAAQSAAQELGSTRQSQILAQLNQRREELTTIQGQLEQVRKQAELETIKAPIAGTIYNIQATTGEGTIEQGEELLSILPEGENLMLEVKVLNRDIGFISEGMRAKVKIATFPFQEFGTIEGTVLQVSPNAVADRELGLVFTTRVRLNQNAVRVNQQDVKLVPGMTATAEIVTRQKSILTFLLEPVSRRFDEAFSVR